MSTYSLRGTGVTFEVDYRTGVTVPKLDERTLLDVRARSFYAPHVWLKIVMANVDDPRKMSTGLRMKILEQIGLCTNDEVREQAEEWLNPTKTASKR